jgi:tetratricopeptide (TPR) repeat protein
VIINSFSIKTFPGLLILCAVFLFGGISRLNELSIYTPDSSKYLIWGNSLAHGKGFVDDTQPEIDRFVPNAPLYSLLIAPVEYFFPGSIIAIKIWTLVFGVVAIFLFYYYLRRLLGNHAALIGTAFFALNPAMLLFSTEMLSEAPFIALMLAILIVSEPVIGDDASNGKGKFIFLTVFLSCIALLREAGIALVLAVLIHFLISRHPVRALILFICSVALLGIWYYRNQIWVSSLQGQQKGNLYLLSQHYVTPPDASIVNEFVLRIWQSGKVYLGHMGEMFFYSFSSAQFYDMLVAPSALFNLIQSSLRIGNVVIAILLLLFMTIGVIMDYKRRQSAGIRLLATGFFLVIVFTYPVHDIRFFVPLYPLFIFYLLEGVRWCILNFSFVSVFRRLSVAYILSGIILFPNILAIGELIRTNQSFLNSPKTLINKSNHISSLYRFDWHTLGVWIQQHTSERTTFASPLKELAVVAGGRKVLDIDPGTTVSDFEIALRNSRIDYVLAVVQGDLNLYDFQMSQTRRFWFEPVCDADNLHLLRVHSQFLDPVVKGKMFSPADTVSSIRLMRAGNHEISEGSYAQAESTLIDAYHRFPRQPSIVYTTMTAAFMQRDTVLGNTMYRNLMSLPQTMSYVKLARVQLDALRFLSTSATSGMMEERAVTRLKSASLYWKLGYYHHAGEIMDTLLLNSSQYFFGLLWGLHFNLQNGDTVKARRYLSKVTEIDSTNIVGKSFARVLRLADSLRLANSDLERSGYYLAIGKIYFQIDLKEETIDEAEKALHANPHNLEAAILIGRVYERKGATRTSEQIFRKVLLQNPLDTVLLHHADSLRKILDK